MISFFLVRFLLGMLPVDSELVGIFKAANAAIIQYANNVASPVAVYRNYPRIAAAYPVILLFGMDDNQRSYGDLQPIFFTGRLKVEVITKQDDLLDPDPLATLELIQQRLTQLLLGYPNSAEPSLALPGVRGQILASTAWGDQYNMNCSEFHQTAPSGDLPVVDPTLFRWGATYKTTVYRTST